MAEQKKTAAQREKAKKDEKLNELLVLAKAAALRLKILYDGEHPDRVGYGDSFPESVALAKLLEHFGVEVNLAEKA